MIPRLKREIYDKNAGSDANLMQNDLMMRTVVSALVVLSLLSLSSISTAKPAFATKEKKSCNYCHSVDTGGGPQGFRATYYKAHKLSFKGFVEAKEAKKAGVKKGAVGKASKATKPYTGK